MNPAQKQSLKYNDEHVRTITNKVPSTDSVSATGRSMVIQDRPPSSSRLYARSFLRPTGCRPARPNPLLLGVERRMGHVWPGVSDACAPGGAGSQRDASKQNLSDGRDSRQQQAGTASRPV